MNIAIGSKNPAKIQAISEVFSTDSVSSVDVASQVSAQPLSDEETRRGAMNRAIQCVQSDASDMGIGLEGGVMYMEGQLYLCNWGALAIKDKEIITASGARIALPDEFDHELKRGMELGDLMDVYVERKDVRKNDGAIGVLTNGLIKRKEMFVHVVRLLKGQLGNKINRQ